MQEYQKEEAERDDRKKEEERQKYLKELKDEMAKLKDMKSLSDADYVKKLFDNFPPRNKKHTYDNVKGKLNTTVPIGKDIKKGLQVCSAR